MGCQGIECCCRCAHRLELKNEGIIGSLWICNAEKPCKETKEHDTCDLWEYIPTSMDYVSRDEQLYRAVSGAQKAIEYLGYVLGGWNEEEGRPALKNLLLKINLAVGNCAHALSGCVDESREFAAEKGIRG